MCHAVGDFCWDRIHPSFAPRPDVCIRWLRRVPSAFFSSFARAHRPSAITTTARAAARRRFAEACRAAPRWTEENIDAVRHTLDVEAMHEPARGFCLLRSTLMQHACESVAGGGTPAHTAHRTGPARTGSRARGSGTPRSHELYTKYFFEAKCTLVLSEMATPSLQPTRRRPSATGRSSEERAQHTRHRRASGPVRIQEQNRTERRLALGLGSGQWPGSAASAHRTLRFRRYNVKEFGVPAGGNEAGRVVGCVDIHLGEAQRLAASQNLAGDAQLVANLGC